jgi:hypothetical protein
MARKLLTNLRCAKEHARVAREIQVATKLRDAAKVSPLAHSLTEILEQRDKVNAATAALLECRKQKG